MMSKRPRFRAYHNSSPVRPARESVRFLLHDVTVSMKPVIVTCGVGAAGCAEAPDTAPPTMASAMRARDRTLVIVPLLEADGPPRCSGACRVRACGRDSGRGSGEARGQGRRAQAEVLPRARDCAPRAWAERRSRRRRRSIRQRCRRHRGRDSATFGPAGATLEKDPPLQALLRSDRASGQWRDRTSYGASWQTATTGVETCFGRIRLLASASVPATPVGATPSGGTGWQRSGLGDFLASPTGGFGRPARMRLHAPGGGY